MEKSLNLYFVKQVPDISHEHGYNKVIQGFIIE